MSREEKKKKVIEVLNKAKGMELQAIHQYMHQHYYLDDKDYGELAANVKLISIDEMRHAESLAERIKELGGEPTTELDGPVETGQDIEEIFPFNAKQEDDAIEAYTEFLQVCRDNGDTVSVRLLEIIIEHEQDHYNYFDSVDEHIKTLGASYLSRIAGTSSDTGPAKGFSFRDETE